MTSSDVRRPRHPRRTLALGIFLSLLTCAVFAPVGSAQSPTQSGVGGSTGGVLPAEPGSEQDPAFVALKNAGRIGPAPDGSIVVLPYAPATVASVSAELGFGWTQYVWEPKGSGGVDDNNVSYSDPNYWNFCGPGAAAVAMYYFPKSQSLDVGIAAANYSQPRNNPYHATTYWKAIDSVSKGRGALMWMAEYEKPPVSYSWPLRGIVNWSNDYPTGTPTNRLRDGVNWEASGRTNINYFYVQATASSITQAILLSHVQSDIGISHATIANVRTTNGTVSLPEWTKSGAVNHSITIIGYDNTTSDYTYIDTCGPGCNNTGKAAGVYTVSQATMWTLLKAETDNDGILW